LDCCGDAKIVYQLLHALSGHEQRIPFRIFIIIWDATYKNSGAGFKMKSYCLIICFGLLILLQGCGGGGSAGNSCNNPPTLTLSYADKRNNSSDTLYTLFESVHIYPVISPSNFCGVINYSLEGPLPNGLYFDSAKGEIKGKILPIDEAHNENEWTTKVYLRAKSPNYQAQGAVVDIDIRLDDLGIQYAVFNNKTANTILEAALNQNFSFKPTIVDETAYSLPLYYSTNNKKGYIIPPDSVLNYQLIPYVDLPNVSIDTKTGEIKGYITQKGQYNFKLILKIKNGLDQIVFVDNTIWINAK
jgi:hypothetical protein